MRADRYGEHRRAFDRNSKKIIRTQTICALCGKEVDKSLKYPNPFAASVDHIIPIARGGHPSDVDNLQLTHWICNNRKGDKLATAKCFDDPKVKAEIGNRDLPQSRDWAKYDG